MNILLVHQTSRRQRPHLQRPSRGPWPGFITGILLLTLLLVVASTSRLAIAEESSTTATDEKPILRMAIFPRRNAELSNRIFSPLANYLSSHLDYRVKLQLYKNFSSFWRALERGDYDLVHYNQYHYVRSHKERGDIAILRNEEFGEASIAGSLVVRKDSRIKTIADLKGQHITFGGGPQAMQSYITATYLLQQGGLKKGDYISSFSKNPPNAIVATYTNQAAAAGVGDKVLFLKSIKRTINIDELRFLARDRQLPHLPWAVNKSLPKTVRDKIQQTLANMREDSTGKKVLKLARLTALVPTKDDDYDSHREIIKQTLGEQY